MDRHARKQKREREERYVCSERDCVLPLINLLMMILEFLVACEELELGFFPPDTSWCLFLSLFITEIYVHVNIHDQILPSDSHATLESL